MGREGGCSCQREKGVMGVWRGKSVWGMDGSFEEIHAKGVARVVAENESKIDENAAVNRIQYLADLRLSHDAVIHR